MPAIENFDKVQEIINYGPYAWPGGYPIYFVTADGGVLSWHAVRDELDTIADAMQNYDGSPDEKQWTIIGWDINWEDDELFCDHTEKRIPSAYAED